MPSPTDDLEYLKAASASLEQFLLSDELRWPLGAHLPAGASAFPNLTIESILLARARLQAQALSVSIEASFRQVAIFIDTIRNRWRVAWSQKAGRAFTARLNLWSNFVAELIQEPDQHLDRYTYEVRLRVMLELLTAEAEQITQDQKDALARIDQTLHAGWRPGKFIWGNELKNGFPETVYWYLYGSFHDQQSHR